jgi:glycosyltransferase involved in cell wall biosynthesis
MSLTILVFAINVEHTLGRAISHLRTVSPDVVVAVDDSATDRTFDVAREHTDEVYCLPHRCFLAAGQPEHVNALEDMLPYCRGNWVLRIDQDETLSDKWTDPVYVPVS